MAKYKNFGRVLNVDEDSDNDIGSNSPINSEPIRRKTYGSTGAGSEEDGKIKPKLKYPKSVFFIISNEFCERFSYYGMRTILSLYLESKLKYSEEDSTRIYHTFVMLCYFFPIIGAIVADSYLGKFKTIFYLSIVYAIGSVTISISSSGLGPLGKSEHLFSLFGLLLIAMGTGGIKPCVSSFGGDQFVLPEQERQLQQFFSVFYFSINAGSLISTFLTPELREDVACLDQDTCYPLAFGVPAVLMVVSLIIFVCGRFMYKMKKPAGNVIVDITKCSAYALKKKITTKGGHYEHWLDYAQDKYNRKLIDDTKIVMSLILLFSPTILFWSLYEQQGTSWIFQAKRMNGRIGGYTIKPDQMQVLNPILILAFIPLFEWVIYPILSKLHLVRTPLQKLVIGGLLVSVAFIVAAFVEQKIQPTYEILPQQGEAQLRIINSYNCPATVNLADIDGNPYKIDKLGILQLRNLQAKDTKDIGVSVNILKSECSQLKSDLQYKGTISITEQESVSYFISNKIGSESGILLSRLGKYDTIRKSDKGEALIRIAYQVDKNSKLELAAGSKLSFDLSVNDHVTDLQSAEPGSYKLNLNGKEIGDVPIEFGGVYTILITEENTTTTFNIYEISPPSTVHILWQLPQICILTAAEIMFSITGLEFSYSQAPKSMKSVISSLWLLTDSVGNMFVVGLSTIFERQTRVVQFLIYAGLMVLVMAIFALLAWRYRYVTPDNDEDEEESSGQDNPAYKTEE